MRFPSCLSRNTAKNKSPGSISALSPWPEAPWAQLAALGAFGLDELGEDGDHGLGLLLVVPRVELSRGPRGHPPKMGLGPSEKHMKSSLRVSLKIHGKKGA